MDEFLESLRKMLPVTDLRNRSALLGNLAFMFQVIRASEDLLMDAAAYARGGLHEYFHEHLGEEMNHAEWLAQDLKNAGVDVYSLPISAEAVAMVGSQYYLIRHVDPAALLGYMLALECFPASVEDVEQLERTHGADVCRTLRHHAIHDQQHGKDVLEQIAKLSEKQHELVKQNAVQTVLYLRAAAEKFNGGAHA